MAETTTAVEREVTHVTEVSDEELETILGGYTPDCACENVICDS